MNDLGNKEIMAENLKRYMELKEKNAADICRDLNIKKAAFSTWINAKAYPRIDKIEQMANYFHCTKADLVERKREVPDYVPGTVEIVDLYSRATPEQRQAVLALLRSFVQE